MSESFKVTYRTLNGAKSTAYVEGPPDAEDRYPGQDKYTDADVLVVWSPDADAEGGWVQVREEDRKETGELA
jgi:hypothetical protein